MKTKMWVALSLVGLAVVGVLAVAQPALADQCQACHDACWAQFDQDMQACDFGPCSPITWDEDECHACRQAAFNDLGDCRNACGPYCI